MHFFNARVRVGFRSRHAFVMFDQAADARNTNDVSRRCRDSAAAKHGLIIDALMRPIVVPKRLKFSQRQP